VFNMHFLLSFQINYNCKFGDSVYVTGNAECLGNWNPHKALSLTWSEGNIWTAKIKLSHQQSKTLEYKYFIAPTEGEKSSHNLYWESGPNRLVNLWQSSNLHIKLEDVWQHTRVKIALKDQPFSKSSLNHKKKVILFTDLSCYPEAIEMKTKKYIFTKKEHEELYWVAELQVPNHITQFRYRFQFVSLDTQEVINDLAHRKFCFNKFPKYQSSSEMYSIQGISMMKVDFVFETSVNFTKITEQLFVGSFPQTAQDIDNLTSQGIRAILNLQTILDVETLCVNWNKLKKYYNANDIIVEHYPMVDELEEIKANIHKVGDLIHRLIQEHGKVYVHCNVGKSRSPHAVAYYLWKFQNLDLKAAIAEVKTKRPKVRIYEEVFKVATH